MQRDGDGATVRRSSGGRVRQVVSQTRTGWSWEQGDNRADASGSGLRIGFVHIGDRWTHLLALPGERGIELARAVEGQPDRDEPERVVSPLYQELERHDRRDDQSLCLLMTGR